MFRLFSVFIGLAVLVLAVFSVVWYFQTPQPVGTTAQIRFVQQTLMYQYNDFKRDAGEDTLLYWLPLADSGNAPAQTRVAEIYFSKGQSNPENYKLAVSYLDKAAALGLPKAQNALGVAYRNGLGIESDKIEAWKWFKIAGQQGLDLAQKNLTDITPELTARELDSANDRVRVWLENHQN